MKTFLFIFLCFCLGGLNYVSGQGEEPDLSPFDFNNITLPESPTGASLGKFGDIPVNMATGVPNINIPIFSFEVDGLTVPITLAYHASGVQVNELHTAVGLNWTLNAGGGIFRSINSLPDEDGWITSYGPLDDSFYAQFSNIFEHNYRREMVGILSSEAGKAALRDHNPDDYNYNFLGHSGKFIIDFGNEAMKHEADELEIDFDFGNSIIKDQRGNTYFFGDKKERSYRRFGTGSIEAMDTIGGGQVWGAEMDYGSPTGWMLSKILTKNQKAIYFDYDEYEIKEDRTGNRFTVSSSLTLGKECSTANPPVLYARLTNTYGVTSGSPIIVSGYTTQLLTAIRSDSYNIYFIYVMDTALDEWKMKLEKIRIENTYNGENKEYYLDYGYFSGVSRLQLQRVYEKKGSMELPGYTFKYISGSLPNRYSFSQDLFGYYNGKTNPSSLVPYDSQIGGLFSSAGFIDFYNNNTSDRSPDSQLLQIGTLEKIVYPTGGNTEFYYEPNTELQSSFVKYCGGIRLEKVEHKDSNENILSSIQYEYEGLVGRSYETDRHNTHTEEEGITFGGGRTFHSGFVQHKSMSLSGYFYENVREIRIVENESLTKEHTFIENYTYGQLSPLLKIEKLYKANAIVKITEYEHEPIGKEKKISWNILGRRACGREFIPGIGGGSRVFTTYEFGDKMHFKGNTTMLPTKIATTEFYASQNTPVTTIKEIEYDDKTLLKLTETFDTRYTRNGDFSYTLSNPDGERIVSKFYYPTTPNNEGFPYDFPTSNLLKKEIFNETGNTKILGQAMEYDNFGNIKTVYAYNKGEQTNTSGLNYVPIDYEKMTAFIYQDGFPVQVIDKEGTPLSYIWNKNGNFIAAKIEGLTRDEINPTTIGNIEDASYSLLPSALSALSAINSEDAFVTTFIVNPLTGLEEVTDPKGEKIYYEYDAFGRLKVIRDLQGNILEETEYNYRLNHEP